MGGNSKAVPGGPSCASLLQEFLPEDLESLDLGWNPIDESGFEAWDGLRAVALAAPSGGVFAESL